jgi:hypothetical protein
MLIFTADSLFNQLANQDNIDNSEVSAFVSFNKSYMFSKQF